MPARPILLSALSLLAGLSALVLTAASTAQAFTFEDSGAAQKGDDTSMFYNSYKSDPLASRLDSSGSSKSVIKQGNATIFFGGQQFGGDRRGGPDSYFSPNVLMGK